MGSPINEYRQPIQCLSEKIAWTRPSLLKIDGNLSTIVLRNHGTPYLLQTHKNARILRQFFLEILTLLTRNYKVFKNPSDTVISRCTCTWITA